jgi:hypothetical protein
MVHLKEFIPPGMEHPILDKRADWGVKIKIIAGKDFLTGRDSGH